MDKNTERIIKDYELSCTVIAEAFLNKQFHEEGEPPVTVDDFNYWWIDVGGALSYGGEQFYSFADILTDLKEDAPKGEIDKYNEWALRCSCLNIEPKCNYRSWLHGAPHITDEELDRLEKMKKEFEDEIKKYNNESEED